MRVKTCKTCIHYPEPNTSGPCGCCMILKGWPGYQRSTWFRRLLRRMRRWRV